MGRLFSFGRVLHVPFLYVGFLTFPHTSAISPNHLNPANPFQSRDFRQSHSIPPLPILERSLSTTDSLPQSLPTSVLRIRAAHLAA
ncbi:MAG: hypothetical protein ACYDHE_01020, partial [Candidatus Acidiferrales bacterium]